MSSAREFAESAIRDNKVVVFSKSTCPFCIKTKTTLTGLNIPFHAIELDVSGYITLNYSSLPISNSIYVIFLCLQQRADGGDIQDALLELTKQRTVPNVFVNGKHIGGNDATQAAIKDGSFQAALKA